MGYYSRLFGKITFDKVKDDTLIEMIENTWSIRPITKTIEKVAVTREGEEFPVGIEYLVGIEGEGDGKMYTLESDLAPIAERLKNVECEGYLVRTGEDNSDIQRYSFKDGKVVVETAQVLWPDGEKVTGIY